MAIACLLHLPNNKWDLARLLIKGNVLSVHAVRQRFDLVENHFIFLVKCESYVKKMTLFIVCFCAVEYLMLFWHNYNWMGVYNKRKLPKKKMSFFCEQYVCRQPPTFLYVPIFSFVCDSPTAIFSFYWSLRGFAREEELNILLILDDALCTDNHLLRVAQGIFAFP